MFDFFYAIISAVTSVWSTMFTNNMNGILQSNQQKWNEEMRDYENEYNLPVNQLQRYKDAGINPVSMTMSNGSLQSGNTSASTMPYQTIPTVDPFSTLSNTLSSLAGAFSSFQSGKDLSVTREFRLQKMKEENNLVKEQARNLGLSSDAQMILNKYLDAKEYLSMTGMKITNDMNYWQISKINKECEYLSKQINELLPAEIAKLVSERDVNVLDLSRLIALTENIEADTALKGAQKEGVEASTELTGVQTANEELRGEQIQAETALTDEQVKQYRETLDLICQKFEAEIERISAETNLTVEEVRWFLAEKVINPLKRSIGAAAGIGTKGRGLGFIQAF